MEVSVEKPILDLKKNKKEVENHNDDKDVFAKLIKNVVISENLPVLLLGYFISKGC